MDWAFLHNTLIGILLLLVAGGVLAKLLTPRIRESEEWAATATPLASIIGSGFLIVAPVLGGVVGPWAPVAMAGIVAVAWFLGGVVRYQIQHAEPLLAGGPAPRGVRGLEGLSDLAISLAYIVSVAFYVRLLSAFVLHGISESSFHERILTSGTLLVIGVVGVRWGLSALERLETTAVATKLAIIAALLVGLVLHDGGQLAAGTLRLPRSGGAGLVHTLRVLAGLVLIVQGFETSRFLSAEHGAELRSRTLARAQLVTGAIYVAFVLLVTPVLFALGGAADETAIILVSGVVHPLLPGMLILAAVMSQFSAAVADTIGAGGLGSELSRKRVTPRAAYAAVCGLAIGLTWTADIFEVVALASRGFALYYALQCASAALIASSRGARLRAGWFATLGACMLACVLFAIPAG